MELPEDLIFKMHGAQGGSQVLILEYKNQTTKIIEYFSNRMNFKLGIPDSIFLKF